MEFIKRDEYQTYDAEVQSYDVKNGLNYEKLSSYIAELIAKGFVFESANITSLSDKDSRKVFSGNESYSDYKVLINMLNSEELKMEACVSVSISGKIGGVNSDISFFMDDNLVKTYSPIMKSSEQPNNSVASMNRT